MESPDYDKLKSDFVKAFANVPPTLRKEIIASVGKNTFSWFTAKEEITRGTDFAKPILKQLHEIGVI